MENEIEVGNLLNKKLTKKQKLYLKKIIEDIIDFEQIQYYDFKIKNKIEYKIEKLEDQDYYFFTMFFLICKQEKVGDRLQITKGKMTESEIDDFLKLVIKDHKLMLFNFLKKYFKDNVIKI